MNVSSVKNLNGEVFSAVQDTSLTNVVQTNSGNWQDITAYQTNSGTFLTAINIPESATWNEVSTAYQNNSATYLTAHQDLSDYYTTADANTLSSMLSGAIDYVSANAGDEFPVSADEAVQYVQTNSAGINDVNTSYQTNSGTYLTAHQAISADEWNDCYDNVNTNSGAWGGSALPISAGPGIKVNLVNNTLVFSNDETVLWEGYLTGTAGQLTASLSEPYTNFEKVEIMLGSGSYGSTYTYDSTNNRFQVFSPFVGNGGISLYALNFITNDARTQLMIPEGNCVFCQITGNGITGYQNRTNINVGEIALSRVVGVNRK